MATVVVLNDGETFTEIEGCMIVWVDDFVLNNRGSTEIASTLKDLHSGNESSYAEVITRLGR